MLRELSPAEVTQILTHERIGRLSCYGGARWFVLPVAFHSDDGSRICLDADDELWRNLLKARSRVCFEVDRVEGPTQWASVLGWGELETAITDECPSYRLRLSSVRGFQHAPDDPKPAGASRGAGALSARERHDA